MTAYEIKLSGCDDSTAFVMDLARYDADLLRRMAALSREASTYDCQPVMTIGPAPADEEVAQ